MSLKEEHEWLAKHSEVLEDNRGKWVAIEEKKVVAITNSYIDALKKAREKNPKAMPLIIFAMRKEDEEMIL